MLVRTFMRRMAAHPSSTVSMLSYSCFRGIISWFRILSSPFLWIMDSRDVDSSFSFLASSRDLDLWSPPGSIASGARGMLWSWLISPASAICYRPRLLQRSRERKMAGELWVVSAPGGDSTEQAFQRLTAHIQAHAGCHKLAIPDLKVASLARTSGSGSDT